MKKLCMMALLLVGAAAGAGLVRDEKAAGRRQRPATAKQLLSAAGVEVLQKPAKVEFFRIRPQRSDDAEDTIDGYPIVSPGRTPGDAAERLRSILINDKSYLFNVGKGCEFRPGVAVRVTGEDGRTLNLILCYECQVLKLTLRDAGGGQLHRSGGIFEPAEPKLVRLAKDDFPDDSAIESRKRRD